MPGSARAAPQTASRTKITRSLFARMTASTTGGDASTAVSHRASRQVFGRAVVHAATPKAATHARPT